MLTSRLGDSLNVHGKTLSRSFWFPYVNCEFSELIAVKSHESSEFVELTVVSNFNSISASLHPGGAGTV